MRTPGNRRSLPQRAGTLLLSLLLALILAEVTLRVFGLAHPGGVATMSAGDFQRLPGIYAPNQSVLSLDNPALPHRVTTDSFGYRSAPVARVKPAGEFRILFTGDSFTYGSYVDDSVTVPTLLERRLRLSCPGVRTVNAGLGGSTITDQVKLVQRGLSLTPDLVILMFSENDVTDLATSPSMWTRLEANRRLKSRIPQRYFYALARSTALWNVMLKAKARLDQGSSPAPSDPSESDPAVQGAARRREYADTLRALRDTLSGHGVPLVFAVLPTHLTLTGAQTDDQVRWAIGMGREAGIPTVDVLAALQASSTSGQSLYLLPHDGHTSAAGNRVTASAIVAEVQQHSALRGNCHALSHVPQTQAD